MQVRTANRYSKGHSGRQLLGLGWRRNWCSCFTPPPLLRQERGLKLAEWRTFSPENVVRHRMTTMLGRFHMQGAKSRVIDYLGASVLSEDQITDSGDTDCCISVGALRESYRPIIGGNTKSLESHG
jgi:hypothetical protein